MSKNAKKRGFITRDQIAMPRRRAVVTAQVQAYLNVSRAANTIRGYVSDVKSFLQWGGRIPSKPERVAEFLADEAETKAYGTIRRKAVAISLAHRELGYFSPCQSEIVKSTLRGIKRAKPNRLRQVRPLMAEQVIEATNELSGVVGVRDKALLMIGFAGAFRRAEIVALNVEDFGLRDGNLIARIRSGKTDQFSQGREVVIPKGRGNKCPINALLAWLRLSKITTGAVFRRVDRNEIVLEGRLSSAIVARIVKNCASVIGLDPREYGGHSLRAGYVTSAVACGMSHWDIRRQTGHSSETVLETYYRPVNAASGHLVLGRVGHISN